MGKEVKAKKGEGTGEPSPCLLPLSPCLPLSPPLAAVLLPSEIRQIFRLYFDSLDILWYCLGKPLIPPDILDVAIPVFYEWRFTRMTIQEMNEQKTRLGYSYEQIADLSGVPVSTVRKVLGGATKHPRFATLQALSRIFDPAPEATCVYPEFSAPRISGIAEPAAAYAVQKKQGEYTLEDYLALPDERRVELIDGVIYDMSTPTGYHQLIAGQIHARLLSWISGKNGKCLPFISPVDVQLDCDNKTIVQPDVLILCDPSKYTPARIVGAPDFVVEILSRSTRAKDIFIKLNKYRNAGVREYWIVDPEKKNVLVWEFEKEDLYSMYSFRDQIPVGIYDGELVIDFSEIDDYVSPWM